ncbi:unnamed protein product, partial [Bubo scandiacus]
MKTLKTITTVAHKQNIDNHVFKEKEGREREELQFIKLHKDRLFTFEGSKFCGKKQNVREDYSAGRSTTTDRVDVEFIHHFFPEE